jgi:hypothetical protein
VHRAQILGPAVRRLRRMALDGEAPAVLWEFLAARSFDNFWNQFSYLEEAFLQERMFAYTFPGVPIASPKDERWRSLIAEKKKGWQAQSLPELMRLRDYFAFMRFARDEQVFVVVCGADPASGRWIGKRGVRCYGGRLPVPTSQTAPHDGLLAADPGDPRLVDWLGRFEPSQSYADYVQRLNADGFQVSSPSEGFLVKDDLGNRFHDSYRLHGVSGASDREDVWVYPRAERLRAAINRHLGAELVHFGPHEQWEYRNDKRMAGPLWGPHPPAIEFGPDQEIRNRLTVRELAKQFPDDRHPRWNEVFPNHPIEKIS